MQSKYKIIQERIDLLLDNKENVIIALDGYCAAGKTTLANDIMNAYNCNVFHMDDFFLRPEQRTQTRLAEVGGNVDYERFHNEVLIPLLKREPFSYRPYDCHTCKLSVPISAIPKRLNIIEGTYSMHPLLAHVYDLSVFMLISDRLQRERILQRDPALHKRFFNEWIPMERRYFAETKAQQRCNVFIENK